MQEHDTAMAKIFFHINKVDQPDLVIVLNRVPVAGEFVALSGSDQDWYQVTGVVHLAFEARPFDAEVWGEAANFQATRNEYFRGGQESRDSSELLRRETATAVGPSAA